MGILRRLGWSASSQNLAALDSLNADSLETGGESTFESNRPRFHSKDYKGRGGSCAVLLVNLFANRRYTMCSLLTFLFLCFLHLDFGIIAARQPKPWGPDQCDAASCFTIIVNTFKRHDMLQKSIRHYEQCKSSGMSRIADIRVVWSEQTPVPTAETNPEFFGNHVEVKYESYPTLALSNRFKPLSDLTTDGVLNIDDDIIIECGALQMAFETWQHSQNQLVGWIPRLHTPVDGAKTCGPKGNPVGCKEVTYQNWITVWWEGQYSIILTKMAFMHADYLRIYTEQTPKELIEWVDEHKNCEDILMQFVVSNATRAPPVLVQGAYYDTGIYNGISAGSGHMKFRSECVNKFFGVYGDVLVPSKSFTTSLGNLYSKLSYFGFLYNH